MRIYDDDALRAELERRLIATGQTQRALASELRLHEEVLNVFLRGARPAPPVLLLAMGLTKISVYVEA